MFSKYIKFCCKNVFASCDILKTVVDYCLRSLFMLLDFVDRLQKECKMENLPVRATLTFLNQCFLWKSPMLALTEISEIVTCGNRTHCIDFKKKLKKM